MAHAERNCMIAFTSPYLWYTTRATGLVTLVLFTAVLIVGTLVANRIGGTYIGRFELNELHRSLSMVAVIFLGIHIATTVLDSFVSTGLVSAVIPFVSKYRTLPVALGTIAFDLTLAVWISSLLKEHIRPSVWRAIHWFGYVSFATSLVHAYLTGTDTRTHWALVLVATCGVLGIVAGVGRFLGRPERAAGRTALSPLASARSVSPPAPSRNAPPRATRPQQRRR
jgi:predicted ferric reductase